MDDLAFDWDKANMGHIARHRVSLHEVEQLFANKAVDIDFDVARNVGRRLDTLGNYAFWLSSGRCGKNPSDR